MRCAAAGFTHDALFYRSDAEMVAGAVPFLRAALEASEAVILICGRHTAGLLADATGGDPRIGVIDRSEIYLRAPHAIAAYQQLAESYLAAGVGRLRLLGEVDFGLGRRDWAEWASFEAVLNAAMEPYPLWSVCIYDTRRLPAEVLAAAAHTHPALVAAAVRAHNPHYLDPARYMRHISLGRPDPLEAADPALSVTDPVDLAALRQAARAALAGSARQRETVRGFVFAVSEVTTNALTYGRPPVRVRVWSVPGRSLCSVTDHGGGFDNPLTGYLPPPHDDLCPGGLGLWLARQVCDRISTCMEEGGRFTVRIHSRH